MSFYLLVWDNLRQRIYEWRTRKDLLAHQIRRIASQGNSRSGSVS